MKHQEKVRYGLKQLEILARQQTDQDYKCLLFYTIGALERMIEIRYGVEEE